MNIIRVFDSWPDLGCTCCQHTKYFCNFLLDVESYLEDNRNRLGMASSSKGDTPESDEMANISAKELLELRKKVQSLEEKLGQTEEALSRAVQDLASARWNTDFDFDLSMLG